MHILFEKPFVLMTRRLWHASICTNVEEVKAM